MQDTKAKIINRQMLTDSVIQFTVETYQETKVIPGQRALIAFEDAAGPFQRCYSVLDQDTDNEKTMLIFAIKLLDQGRGSAVLRNLRIGDEMTIKGIFGHFTLQDTPFPKVFIGTGVGIVPVLNMAKYCNTDKQLFFSVSYHKDLFYEEKIKKIHGLTSHIYLSRENIDGYSSGRLDISAYHFAPNTEFYLCGKPEAIQDIIKKINFLGFKNVYFENF